MAYKCIFVKINGTLCFDFADGIERNDAIEFVESYCDDEIFEKYNQDTIDVEMDWMVIGSGEVSDYWEDEFLDDIGINHDTLMDLYANDMMEKTFEERNIFCERVQHCQYKLSINNFEVE